jgi:hypothetical protein
MTRSSAGVNTRPLGTHTFARLVIAAAIFADLDGLQVTREPWPEAGAE